MNECEGAFSLQRSVLSTAEREVRFVPLQKDGLSQLPCAEYGQLDCRCSGWWESRGRCPSGLLWGSMNCPGRSGQPRD